MVMGIAMGMAIGMGRSMALCTDCGRGNFIGRGRGAGPRAVGWAP